MITDTRGRAMNDWNTVKVRIEYADMAKMNKIRAAARKHGATVHPQPYPRDPHHAYVTLSSPCTEGKTQHEYRTSSANRGPLPARCRGAGDGTYRRSVPRAVESLAGRLDRALCR